MLFKKIIIRAVLTFFPLIGLIQSVSAATWREYKSDNFVLYSDVSTRQAKKVIRNLERFRYGVLKFTGKENHPESNPVTFLYFDDRDDFRELTGPDRENVVGYFTESWGGPLMVGWSSNWSISGQSITYHEYVHHLMRSHDTLRYPRWYSEGFAELLASAELRGDSMAVGHAPKWRLYELGEYGAGSIQVRDLLTPSFEITEGNSEEYYAESWLLTHFLLLGELSGGKSYREASAKYILDLANGADPFESFERNMEISPEEASNELRKYRNIDRLKGIRIDLGDIDVEINYRKLSSNEGLGTLAIRALDHYNDDAAVAYLEGTDKSKAGWERNALLSKILTLHAAQSIDPDSKDPEKIEEKGESFALELSDEILTKLERQAGADHETAALLGHYYYDLAAYLGIDHHRHSRLNEQSIAFSQLAIEQNPESLRAYEYLWRAQNRAGHKVDAFRTMMASYKYYPNHSSLNYHIAVHLISLDRLDLAEPFLTKIIDASHNERRRHWAKGVLDKLKVETSEVVPVIAG